MIREFLARALLALAFAAVFSAVQYAPRPEVEVHSCFGGMTGTVTVKPNPIHRTVRLLKLIYREGL